MPEKIKHLLNCKYFYLMMFLLTSLMLFMYSCQMSEFLTYDKSQNLLDYLARRKFLRDLHRHPERYPDYDILGNRIQPKAYPVKPVLPDIKADIDNSYLCETMVPFQLKDANENSVTDVSFRLDAPAGKYGFVRPVGDYFATENGRMQFTGVNLSFDSNFPKTRKEADDLVMRLARFGFNAVRLTHADAVGFWRGSPNQLTINPQQIDKFDYLIYALKQKGIYTCLNLHVSRTLQHRDGFAPTKSLFDKGVGLYSPEIIEANRQFAKDLLTHINPYTKTAYSDEPAVALIEISNEDSICQTWRNGQLVNIAPYYLKQLQEQWNRHLQSKYGTDAVFRKESGFTDVPLGQELLPNLTASDEKKQSDNFYLAFLSAEKGMPLNVSSFSYLPVISASGIQGDKKAAPQVDKKVIRINDKDKSFLQCKVMVEEEKTYTFAVTLRSGVPSSVLLKGYSFDKKRSLGIKKAYTVSDFETYEFVFKADITGEMWMQVTGFIPEILYDISAFSFKEGGKIDIPVFDNRIKVREPEFVNLYSTAVERKKALPVLASILLMPVQDSSIRRDEVLFGFRAEKGKEYRCDLLMTGTNESPFDVQFKQDGKVLSAVSNIKETRTLSPVQAIPLSFNVKAETDGKIDLCVNKLLYNGKYQIDVISWKENYIPSSELIALEKGNIPLLFYDQITQYPQGLQNEWLLFLLNLDRTYWKKFYDYLKNELHVKANITGTQLEYGSVHGQSGMDYCDIHAYHDHPIFPNRPWDGSDYFFHNRPLVEMLDKSPLLNVATKRVAGKPYIVSEYGHTMYNRFSAESMPLLYSFGAFQNWSGVFYYEWGDLAPFAGKIGNFFSIKDNPAVMVHAIACNKLLSDKYNNAEKMYTVPLSQSKEDGLFLERKNTYAFGFNGLELDIRTAMVIPTGLELKEGEVDSSETLFNADVYDETGVIENHYFKYKKQKDALYFLCDLGDTFVFTGFARSFATRRFSIDDIYSTNSWMTMSCTDIKTGPEGKHYLLAVTGCVGNTGQQYQRVEGSNVTLNNAGVNSEGKAPVLCEIPELLLTIKSDKPCKLYALGGGGERRDEIPFTGNSATLRRTDTLWYELVEMTEVK